MYVYVYTHISPYKHKENARGTVDIQLNWITYYMKIEGEWKKYFQFSTTRLTLFSFLI